MSQSTTAELGALRDRMIARACDTDDRAEKRRSQLTAIFHRMSTEPNIPSGAHPRGIEMIVQEEALARARAVITKLGDA